MTRRGALLVLVVAAVAAGAPGDAVSYPARLQVTATEYRLALSRAQVPAGRVKIELVNYGEDPHDLKLRRFGAARIRSIPKTAPGERTTRTFRLRAGRYHVWCALGNHRERGMHAVLRVARR